jgi:hypothetical protein
MPQIVQGGSYNAAALSAPGVVVQILPPDQTVITGVPTNGVGLIGTATWGKVNSPVTIGSLQEQVQNFGPIQTNQYDLGTALYAASQQAANNFICVRVTDGTDTAASVAIVDTTTPSAITGLTLTALYTGSYGDNIQVTIGSGSAANSYRVTISLPNQTPEVFNNITGSGATLWANIANAINLGQSGARAPSQLVVASLNTAISAVSVTAPGSYATLPSLSATIGSGATLTPRMKAVSATVAAAGSGYAAGDTITLAGGTSTTATVITVDTVSGGAIATYTITTAGNYSALPTSPVSQASTSGSGTGATFNVLWGLLSVTVGAGGTGYTPSSALVVSGGGGTGGAAGTLTLSPSNPPELDTYTLTGGTDGITGVDGTTLLGDDSATPRSGMYALRNTDASIGVLVDCDDSTTWTDQIAFGLEEGIYMILVGTAGQTVSSAISAKTTAAIASYAGKFMLGDWCYWYDATNTVTRLISPQGFIAGRLGNLSPENSSLNKPIYGIVATEKSSANQPYSQADILQLVENGIDVIASPSQGGTYFGAQTGLNTSPNILSNDDNYTRMTNFLAWSIANSTGGFIGQNQTVTLRLQAKAAIQAFLRQLQQLNMIGTLDGSPAFKVTLDNTNNSDSSVAEGIMICTVQVVTFHTVRVFLVDLQTGDVTLQSSQQIT